MPNLLSYIFPCLIMQLELIFDDTFILWNSWKILVYHELHYFMNTLWNHHHFQTHMACSMTKLLPYFRDNACSKRLSPIWDRICSNRSSNNCKPSLRRITDDVIEKLEKRVLVSADKKLGSPNEPTLNQFDTVPVQIAHPTTASPHCAVSPTMSSSNNWWSASWSQPTWNLFSQWTNTKSIWDRTCWRSNRQSNVLRPYLFKSFIQQLQALITPYHRRRHGVIGEARLGLRRHEALFSQWTDT